jgi:Flp pilus assembly pilin Flp
MHKLYEHVLLALYRMKREEGQGATEYGLVIAFLVLVIAASVGALGDSISAFLTDVGAQLEALI